MYAGNQIKDFKSRKNLKSPKNWEWLNLSKENTAKNFCQDTSLHGCAYIGEKGRHICERLFWVVSFLSAAAAAGFLIYKLWSGHSEMPIVTVVSPSRINIDEIPFPAVTVCNINRVKKSKVNEYIRRANNTFGNEGLNDTELLLAYAALNDIRRICSSVSTLLEKFTWHEKEKIFFEIPENINLEMKKRRLDFIKFSNQRKIVKEVAHDCRDLVILCSWMGKPWNCTELFQRVQTDYGYCCTFNTIPVSLLVKSETHNLSEERWNWKDWKNADLNTDNLLLTKKLNRSVPLRQKYSGRPAGLSFVVNPHLHEYSCATTDSHGFMVTLTGVIDYAGLMSIHSQIAVPVNSEVLIGVKPEVIVPEESIATYAPDVRQCYLDQDFPLAYFNKYTLSNCVCGCLANKFSSDCGCVPYFMPVPQNVSTCAYKNLDCMKRARRNIYYRGIGETCESCLPTCSEIKYHGEASTLTMREENLDMFRKLMPKFNSTQNLSLVHVFMTTNSIFPVIRKEMYTRIDLISAAGGLLGLCMGFSILSLLEMIYYFTIRVCCNLYKRKRDAEATQAQILFVASNQKRSDFLKIDLSRGYT